MQRKNHRAGQRIAEYGRHVLSGVKCVNTVLESFGWAWYRSKPPPKPPWLSNPAIGDQWPAPTMKYDHSFLDDRYAVSGKDDLPVARFSGDEILAHRHV